MTNMSPPKTPTTFWLVVIVAVVTGIQGAKGASVSSSVRSTGYVNYWDAPLAWDAPIGYAVVGTFSYHDNGREDRRWGFRYAKINKRAYYDGLQKLHVTNYDNYMWRECYHGYMMTSFTSWHSNYREDRQWVFRCARVPRSSLSDCHWTKEVNDYDRRLDYRTPADYVLAGVRSYHHNGKEDRRFLFKICKLVLQ
ncbi:hemagglutinin/amebocyte aggregation factor-like [Corticium candelabrum]|uniref:hemagglutinin/amebocyte aggregation factor-like n=1 Tax=Corticium candelabrum TaxID=121492 RepID=UPI002E26E9B5|nr:hemagglutinin/amebocyte aggregation factor-like [Corticium candelabrum]